MEVCAVAHVGKDVLGAAVPGNAEPGRTFAAHLGNGDGVAAHHDRHQMAADAAQRTTALGHLGRLVVRAAGTEVGRAHQRHSRPQQGGRFPVEEGQVVGDARRGVVAREARGDGARHQRRGHLRGGRQQPALGRHRPFAGFVVLADHAGPNVFAPVVEHFLQLVFDDLALLLDHQDFFEALSEIAYRLRFQRPGHAHLEQAQADVGGVGCIDAEVVERLAHVEVGLAAGDDAQPRARAVEDDAVELVGARIGDRRIDLEFL